MTSLWSDEEVAQPGLVVRGGELVVAGVENLWAAGFTSQESNKRICHDDSRPGVFTSSEQLQSSVFAEEPTYATCTLYLSADGFLSNRVADDMHMPIVYGMW